MRLDKFLANTGIGTRKEIIQFIEENKIKINSEITTNIKLHLDETIDKIYFNDNQLSYQELIYLMLYKPQGVISATSDIKHKTLYDIIPTELTKIGLFPVGRLDKDTEGLILLTNDGKLAHKLLKPEFHVKKKYYVELRDELTQENAILLEKGILLDDIFLTKPSIIEYITPKSVYITISEGKYHQIKRMFKQIRNRVEYLKRIQMDEIILDENLLPGSFRYLTESELYTLKKHI